MSAATSRLGVYRKSRSARITGVIVPTGALRYTGAAAEACAPDVPPEVGPGIGHRRQSRAGDDQEEPRRRGVWRLEEGRDDVAYEDQQAHGGDDRTLVAGPGSDASHGQDTACHEE